MGNAPSRSIEYLSGNPLGRLIVSGPEFIDSFQETELTTLLNVEEPRSEVSDSDPASEPLHDLRSVAESDRAGGC